MTDFEIEKRAAEMRVTRAAISKALSKAKPVLEEIKNNQPSNDLQETFDE